MATKNASAKLSKEKKIIPEAMAELTPIETRGRKPKELSAEDVRNQAKELILSIRELSKQKNVIGKPTMRFDVAAINIERIIRTNLID